MQMNKMEKKSKNLMNHQFKEYYMAELTNFERTEEPNDKRVQCILKDFDKVYELYGYRKFFNEILDYFFQFCLRENDLAVSLQVIDLVKR